MIETNFIPFPTLTTERLILRKLEASDAKDIFSHRSDDNVNTHLEGFRHPTIEDTHAFINRVIKEIAFGKTILWVLTQKDNNTFMGTVCFWNISKDERKAETGYSLVTEYHGMGYMNEALEKIIDFGFNVMKLKTIEAYTHESNEASIKLLQKNKFKQEATLKKEVSSNRIFFTLEHSSEE